jgi:hypothetical protein
VFSRPRTPSTTIRITNPWHAVSVQASGNACPVCKQITGIRFLSAEAPKLPLADCLHAAACRCVYRHHDDRRAGPRRALERGSPLRGGSLYPGEERRAHGGRRRTD